MNSRNLTHKGAVGTHDDLVTALGLATLTDLLQAVAAQGTAKASFWIAGSAPGGQENVIKDWLLPLGLDTNHGYATRPVLNSKVEKRRTLLRKRLENVRRWAERARMTAERASKRYTTRWQAAKAHEGHLYRDLNRRIGALEEQDLPAHLLRAQTRELAGLAKSSGPSSGRIVFTPAPCSLQVVAWYPYRGYAY